MKLMSGSLVLRSGVGTAMLMVSSSQHGGKIGGGAQLARLAPAGPVFARDIADVRIARIDAAGLFFAQVDAGDVKAGLGELDSQRKADISQPYHPDARIARLNLFFQQLGRCCNWISELHSCKLIIQVEFTFAPRISAGPQRKASLLHSQIQRTGGCENAYRGLGRCRAQSAATAAPVDPVPELFVSPAPRSQKRTSMACSSTARMNETLVRLGKCGWRSISAPIARQSKSKVLDRHGALRIAHIHQCDVARAGGKRQVEAPGQYARGPHVHLEMERQVRCAGTVAAT